MPEPVSAPSLPEARNTVLRDHQRQHNHNRLHSRNNSDTVNHNHNHNHNHHIRSQHHHHYRTDNKRDVSQRDNTDIVIVETVSIIEIVDATGSIVDIKTLPPSDATTIAQPEADPTTDVDVSSEVPAYPTSSSDSSSILPTDSSRDDTTLSQSTDSPTVTPLPSDSSMSPFPTLSYSPITSASFSQGSPFPTFPSVTNSTQALSTSLLNTNSSSTSVLSATTSSLQTSNSLSSTFFASSGFGSSSSSSTPTTSFKTFSSSSYYPSSTSDSDTDIVGGAGGETSSPSSPSATNGSSESDGPPVGTVAGSVLGGIAGLAFILLLALALIKWKKRQNALKLAAGSGGERGIGGSTAGGDSGPGGAGGMSEQSRPAPFAVPAALASLTKRGSQEGGAKGFQKISGRKLPSVLTNGGDGYTDPRDTIMSDATQGSYRDSNAFLGNPRFAVGSPMRPESGVPVYHPGPSKTPVTEQGPFSDQYAILEPPRRDPLGRSGGSHDGSIRSQGSRSRFSENL